MKDETEFDRFGYLFFLYLCKLHSNNLFHGDVKPDNLFEFRNMISSDAGTLLALDQKNNKAKYIIHCYSPGYASMEHKKAVNNGEPRTKNQLILEDRF